jgi:predicted DsbA family dithiol-disulfide isomerase
MGYYLRRAALEFATVSTPGGFRRLKTASGGLSSFVGGFEGVPAAPLSAARLCDITFRGQGQEAGNVVIASFSDFFCPYCRVLDKQLHEIADGDARVTLVSHQVPLLGAPSMMAARGGIAAQRQGVYPAYFKRLIRTTFVPNPAYLRDFAQGQGLDVAQFEADLTSAQTQRQLDESAAAFRAFGFVGTPGVVVGRTLINGVIAPRDLRTLVKVEVEETGPTAC